MVVQHIDGSNIAAMVRGNQQRANAAPVGYTSVTEGALEIRSEQGFYVGGQASAFIDGLLKVLGELELTGQFILSGNTNASGAWNQSGSFTLTGPFTVEGNTSMTGSFTSTGDFTLTGPFHINGATDLNGIMTIHSSGKIVIEGPVPMEIANGAITSGGAQLVFTSGVGMQMIFGASTITAGVLGAGFTNGSAGVVASVLGGVTISGGQVYLKDLPAKP